MVLPEPVWSDDNIKVAKEVIRSPSSLISNAWSKDPMKLAILRALDSCQAKLGYGSSFGSNIVDALAQKGVRFLHSYSLEVEEVHC